MSAHDAEPLPGEVYKDGDYTYYVSNGHAGHQRYEDILEPREGGKADERYSGSRRIRIRDTKGVPPSAGSYLEGRALACRCYRKQEIAITFRRLVKGPDFEDGPGGAKPKLELPGARETTHAWDDAGCDYLPEAPPDGIAYPTPLEGICELIDERALRGNPTGLVLVTGATNSAKSELTRGLIHRVLKRQALDDDRKRRPHLLTFEDPIEKWLFRPTEPGTTEPSSAESIRRRVEYTPREKGRDVGSLKEAVDDALRQTPSVFYVGEVRDDKEWQELIRFAGTGHLVVATSHAGSLIEAMERIFKGVRAKTPAARGEVAQKLLAVIHQRKVDLQAELERWLPIPCKFEVLLPAMWRWTAGGVAALVSDGLSSVLPNNPDRPNNPQQERDEGTTSAFGRRWFAAKQARGHWAEYLRKKGKLEHLSQEEIDALTAKIGECFERLAIRYDLQGN